jgi:hypothetical protein
LASWNGQVWYNPLVDRIALRVGARRCACNVKVKEWIGMPRRWASRDCISRAYGWNFYFRFYIPGSLSLGFINNAVASERAGWTCRLVHQHANGEGYD